MNFTMLKPSERAKIRMDTHNIFLLDSPLMMRNWIPAKDTFSSGFLFINYSVCVPVKRKAEPFANK